MKVRALKDYYDIALKQTIKKGQEVEMTEERAKELSTEKNKAKMKLVEIINEEPETVSESDTEKEPKKKRKTPAKKQTPKENEEPETGIEPEEAQGGK